MTHHETLLARKQEIETWFAARERAPSVRLPDQMDETRWLDDQRVSDAEAELQRRKLASIETALTFCKCGWTGRCATCDKPISAARLTAVPEAVLCCRCQEAEDAGREPAGKRVYKTWDMDKFEQHTQGFHMAKYRVGR